MKGILFKSEMVRAILEGRKTMTRRIKKVAKPPYEIGEIIYVKETFGYVDWLGEDNGYVYKATDPDWKEYDHFKWKSSLLMPEKAARIFLKVKNLRVENLESISKADAIKEGIERVHGKWKKYTDDSALFEQPTSSFFSLWELIHGKESLDSNPFVWVIEFEKLLK